MCKLITLTCRNCGHVEDMKEYCPYTGHRYGSGFEYSCPSCKGTMEGPEDADIFEDDELYTG